MFKNPFSQSLNLVIEGRGIGFRSTAEMDAWLVERTRPSSRYTAVLIEYRDEALARQIDRFHGQEKAVRGVLAKGDDDLGAAFKRIDPGSFMEDHGWRGLLASLAALGPEYLDYQKTALLRYAEYLGAAREIARTIHANRGGGRAVRAPTPEASAELPGAQRQSLVLSPVGWSPGNESEGDYRRLAKGEPLDVSLAPHQSLRIKLAQHRFLLVSGDPFLLIDEYGNDRRIVRGGLIGRGSSNAVTLDADYRSISRTHVRIEPLAEGRVRITDMSSLGTFIPADEA